MSQKDDRKMRVTNDVYRKLEILKYIWSDTKSYSEVINKLIKEHDITDQTIDGIQMHTVLKDDAKTLLIGDNDIDELSDDEIRELLYPYDLETFKLSSGIMGFQTLINRRSNLEIELKKLKSEIDNYSDEKYYNSNVPEEK